MRKLIFTFLLFILSCYSQRANAVELKGNYTIDSSSAASATNFKNFASAIAFLTGNSNRTDGGINNTAPFGVSGHVVFNVAAGTFSERVVIDGHIPGASDTSTVSFDGGTGNATSRIIAYEASNSNDAHTFQINAARYVYIKNLTIKTLGQNWGWGVHLMGTGLRNIHIKHCIISNEGGALAGMQGTNFIGIVISNSALSITTVLKADSIQIDSNRIINGYYGVTHRGGNAAAPSYASMYRGNTIQAHGAGLILRFIQNYHINNNNIHCLSSMEGTAISLTSNNSTNQYPVFTPEICGNKITGNVLTGIFVSASTNTSGKGLIANNMINGFSATGKGIEIFNSSNWMIHNNTVKAKFASATENCAGILINGGAGNSLINNLVSKSFTGGKSFPVYITAVGNIDSMDYNQIYNAGINSKTLSINNTGFTASTMIGALGFNTHSIGYKTQFLNDSSTYSVSSCNRGMQLLSVTKDIDGITRQSNPSIGANESNGTGLNNDLAVLQIRGPLTVVPSTGFYDVEVLIRNNGANTITNAGISYQLNNGPIMTESLVQPLASCDTVTVRFFGAAGVNLISNINSLSVFVSQPNGASDANTSNDSIHTMVYIPLSGNYNIGTTAGNDFTTFTQAVSALKNAGISGAVRFDVDQGTYNERVTIDQQIEGVSPQNTITFDGGTGNAATRIITYSSQSASDRNTVEIGSGHIRFQNLTVKSTGSDFGFPFHITAPFGGIISDVHVKNCIIDASGTGNPGGQELSGVVVGFNQPGYSPYEGVRADSIVIDSNTIISGAYGIVMVGSSGNNGIRNMIRRNKLVGTRMTGIFLQYQTGVNINNNKIEVVSGASGIELQYSTGDSLMQQTITGNYITNSGMGITLRGTNAVNGRGKLINNVVVANGFVVWTPSGTTNWDIYHNNFIHNTGGTVFYNTSATGIDFKNNILANQGAASGSALASFSGTALTGFNNNIFYQANPDTGVTLFTIQGVSYKRRNFRGGAGFNLNSFASNPGFINDTSDYRLNSGCFIAANTGVTVDINDSVRNNPSDIGAYEFDAIDTDLSLDAITTTFDYPLSAGAKDLTVLIRNTGNHSIFSAQIHYQLNGSAPKTVSFLNSLAPCDTASVTFTGPDAMNILTNLNALKVYISDVNNIASLNRLNDTLTQTISTALNGTYSVGGNNPDFKTLAEVTSALKYGGITGPVVFNIRTGTYTDAIVLDNISGSDSSIIFQSEVQNKDSVNITYAAPSQLVENRIVKLNSRNVHFRQLSFESTSANGAGRIFEIGNASNGSITNCVLTGLINTQHPSFNANPYTLIATYGTNISNFRLNNNEFINGSSALNLQVAAATNNVYINNNKFINQYGSAGYLAYFSNLQFNNNIIKTNTSSKIFNGIAIVRCNLATQVRNNRINIPNGGIGMVLTSCGLAPVSAIPMVVSNNIITLHTQGTDEPYYWVTTPITFSSGLVANYNDNVHIFHNSIQLTGSSAYSTAGAILESNQAKVSFKNNVVANKANSNSVILDNIRTVESDYNNFYSNSTSEFASVIAPGTIGAPGSIFPVQNITGLHAYVFTDSNSVSYNPGYANDSTLVPAPSDSSSWSLNGRGIHIDTSFVSTDYNNVARPYTKQQGIPDIGAYEFTPASVPPRAKVHGHFLADSTVSFISAYAPNDTVAKIKWNTSQIPSGVTVRQYLGEKPEQIDTVSQFMYYYISIEHASAGTYSYRLQLPYKKHWTGTIPHDTVMRLANNVSGLGWLNNYISSSIVKANSLYDSTVSDSSLSFFTGSYINNNFPLPVHLVYFTGKKSGADVNLHWSTGSENNNKGFEIQRSTDGKSFATISFVKGQGNAKSVSNYSYNDINVFDNHVEVVYYRLKQIDENGNSTLSSVITVNDKTPENAAQHIVFPNPFDHEVFVSVTSPKTAEVLIEVYDISGKKVATEKRDVAQGSNTLSISNLRELDRGLYFITVDINGSKQTTKVIKQ